MVGCENTFRNIYYTVLTSSYRKICFLCIMRDLKIYWTNNV